MAVDLVLRLGDVELAAAEGARGQRALVGCLLLLRCLLLLDGGLDIIVRGWVYSSGSSSSSTVNNSVSSNRGEFTALRYSMLPVCAVHGENEKKCKGLHHRNRC